jgi:hypothetical protein
MFGHDERRSWDDARDLGYISAGGGSRWSGLLQRLQSGARVFVHHPHDGYVGVGRVLDGPVWISDFAVTVDDKEMPILEVSLREESIKENADDPELAEYMVRVQWEWAVPSGQGFWARNFLFPTGDCHRVARSGDVKKDLRAREHTVRRIGCSSELNDRDALICRDEREAIECELRPAGHASLPPVSNRRTRRHPDWPPGRTSADLWISQVVISRPGTSRLDRPDRRRYQRTARSSALTEARRSARLLGIVERHVIPRA